LARQCRQYKREAVAARLLDKARNRSFVAETAAMDKGYDAGYVYEEIEARNCQPIIPLMNDAGVKKGRHLPHECEHGVWVYKGTDYKRRAAKWRCPTGECVVSHRWVPASQYQTLISRTTNRWVNLKRGRSSVEREFGRLKHEYGLVPIRTRGMSG